MFAQIRKYKNVEFYKENPTLTFSTMYEENKYKVFAAFITNADPVDDNGYFFDYAVQGFINQNDFLAWVEQVRRRSIINTSVDVIEGDDILTLSTCTYELGTAMDMRFVVMARKVRDGESETVKAIGFNLISANDFVVGQILTDAGFFIDWKYSVTTGENPSVTYPCGKNLVFVFLVHRAKG